MARTWNKVRTEYSKTPGTIPRQITVLNDY